MFGEGMYIASILFLKRLWMGGWMIVVMLEIEILLGVLRFMFFPLGCRRRGRDGKM